MQAKSAHASNFQHLEKQLRMAKVGANQFGLLFYISLNMLTAEGFHVGEHFGVSNFFCFPVLCDVVFCSDYFSVYTENIDFSFSLHTR